MKVRRRDFLKTIGAVGAGMLVYTPSLSAFAKSSKSFTGTKVGGWFPSTCQGCTTWCPVEVFVQNGRTVKIRGNQNSSINPGRVCPRGHMIPKQVYDPDRLKVPMKRTNPQKGKGVDPGFVPITWDEALDEIATKMLELRNNNESHKLLYLRGRYSYSRDILYKAIPKIFGTPNGISHSAICAEAEKSGAYWTEGYWGYRDYDLANTKYLVCWGVDPFRSNREVPAAMEKWRVLKENDATIVTVDPTLTAMATKSDKWLPIKPGEDGALASAIAHHILVNNLWDKTFVGDFNGTGASSFVANTTVNEADFDEAETYGLVKWWNLELKDKTPAWASGITGIAQTVIEEVAEGMAAAAPNVSVWYGPGPVMSTRGTYAGMSIYALNALVGSIDNVGGPLRTVSSSTAGIPAYDAYEDDIAIAGGAYPKIDQRGTRYFPAMKKHPGHAVVTNNVPNAMLAADPYEIKMAICNWGNFAFSGTEPQRWHEALAALPYFVHITTNPSETSQFADIILPAAFATTEKWSYLKTHGNLHTEISIQQPLNDRLFDVKADENEIPFLLAQKLGEKGFSNLYNYFVNEFTDPETGTSPTTPEEFAEFAAKIFTKPSYDTLSGGWTEYKSKGVVTTGPYELQTHWGGNFGTATGKFEFYSETLKEALQEHADAHSIDIDTVLSDCNYQAQGELAFVPHYEEPYRWGDEASYPFTFIDVKSRFNREGRSQNLPWYYQFKKLDPGDNNWDDVIKINPSDAADLGIADGDEVIVTSVVGSFTTNAKLWEGIRPGTVAKSYGQGHWAWGRFASNYESLEAYTGNNNEILPDDYDRISGSTARNGGFTGVKIEKA